MQTWYRQGVTIERYHQTLARMRHAPPPSSDWSPMPARERQSSLINQQLTTPPTRHTAIWTLAKPVDSRWGLHQFRLGAGGQDETLTVLSGHQAHLLSAAARSSWLLEIAPEITHLPDGASCAAWCLD
jgi:hypothetical protein